MLGYLYRSLKMKERFWITGIINSIDIFKAVIDKLDYMNCDFMCLIKLAHIKDHISKVLNSI